MKLRNGFVSNSSSSSFVLIGIDISDMSDEAKEEVLKKHSYGKDEWQTEATTDEKFREFLCYTDYRIHDGDEDGVTGIVIGKRIVDSDDSYLESKTVSISNMNKIGDEIRTFLNLPESKEVKLYTGTRMC